MLILIRWAIGIKGKIENSRIGCNTSILSRELFEVGLSELIFTLKTRGMATNKYFKNVFYLQG